MAGTGGPAAPGLAPGHGTGGVGAATIVLYLAVTLGIQRVIVQQRARRLVASAPAAPQQRPASSAGSAEQG